MTTDNEKNPPRPILEYLWGSTPTPPRIDDAASDDPDVEEGEES